MNALYLEGRLAELVAGASGEVAIAAVLPDGARIGVGAAGAMRSASLIKVPIMMAVLDALADGSVAPGRRLTPGPGQRVGGSGVIAHLSPGLFWPVEDLLTLMIIVSDNSATNALIDLVGMERVNAWCRGQGLDDTALSRHMMDADAVARGLENTTSARDMASVLAAIAGGELPGSEVARRILLAQQSSDRLAVHLPEGWRLAHKTGELDGLAHDAGFVVPAEGLPATIAVLCDAFEGAAGLQEAKRLAADAGDLVYGALKHGAPGR